MKIIFQHYLFLFFKTILKFSTEEGTELRTNRKKKTYIRSNKTYPSDDESLSGETPRDKDFSWTMNPMGKPFSPRGGPVKTSHTNWGKNKNTPRDIDLSSKYIHVVIESSPLFKCLSLVFRMQSYINDLERFHLTLPRQRERALIFACIVITFLNH